MDPLKQSHFAWFGLPERFALDQPALEAAYRRVQATVHPDRFARALESERRMAMQWATQVNEAYRVLRDPTRRARYLCERRGFDLGVESNTAVDPGFLMTQMDWRERLADARVAADRAALQGLVAELRGQREQRIKGLAQVLDESAEVEPAVRAVRELMFIDRFEADLRAALDAADEVDQAGSKVSGEAAQGPAAGCDQG